MIHSSCTDNYAWFTYNHVAGLRYWDVIPLDFVFCHRKKLSCGDWSTVDVKIVFSLPHTYMYPCVCVCVCVCSSKWKECWASFRMTLAASALRFSHFRIRVTPWASSSRIDRYIVCIYVLYIRQTLKILGGCHTHGMRLHVVKWWTVCFARP